VSGGPTQDAADPLLGSRVGAYLVRARLGSGAIGSVYRAEDTRDGTSVALKVLLPELARNAHAVKRLEREAAFVQRLRHPHVVRVHEVGSADGVTYVAMELIAGRTLEETVAREGALGFERVVRLGLDVASALAEAHAQGIVHRDLKPANVMLEHVGGEERAKLVDFGVARLLEDDSSAPLTRLTREGFTVGTPAYMSPEQLGSAAVGPEADLYALGLILHEMVRGVPAFGGGLREVVLKQLTEDPPPIPEHHGLGQLVRWLTAKEPQHRPPSAEVVLAELRAIAERAEHEARRTSEALALQTQLLMPVSAVEPLVSPPASRRKHALLGMAGVALIVVVVVSLGRSPSSRSDGPPRPAPALTPPPLAQAPVPGPGAPPQLTPPQATPPQPMPPPVVVRPAPEPTLATRPSPRSGAVSTRRRGDPCQATSASHSSVQRCLDRLDATLRPKALPPEHVLWVRYRDTWDQVALASTPGDYARLMDALAVLARDVDRTP
jgi:serine/threonine protein kinase